MPVGDPVTDYDGLRQHDIALKTWIDDNLVHKSGTEAETIGGVKTYSSSPLVPTPADDDDSYKAANTAWVKGQFEDLHLPLWVGENGIGTSFYVDGINGNDTTGDGSQVKPWKTISYATSILASDYNVNSNDVLLYVSGGTYTETISLPSFAATTGSIKILPLPDSGAVSIVGTISTGRVVNHTGGSWKLQGLSISAILSTQGSSLTILSLIRSSSSSEWLEIIDCNLSFEDQTAVPVSGTYGNVYAYLVNSTGGRIWFRRQSESAVAWSGSRVNATVDWIVAQNSGQILCDGGFSCNVSSAYSLFAYITGGTYKDNGGSVTWNGVDSPTGKRFGVTRGGTLSTYAGTAAELATYFPGNANGTVENGGVTIPSLQEPFSQTPIYDVTLAEDVPVGGDVGRYTIPFSSPVTAIAFRITVPSAASATSFYLRVLYNDTNSTEPVFGIANFVDTSATSTIGFVKNDHGINAMLISHGSQSASHLAAELYNNIKYVGSARITEMSLAATSAVIPSGTTITVYGSTEV